MKNWEEVFKKRGKFFHEPHEKIVDLVKLFRKDGVKKILDLGCGSGRHIVALSKKGFDIHGMDYSKTGLKETREWLKREGLKAKLKEADCYKKFPYKDDFFDAVISTQVIHHGLIGDIQLCISEIERVLKPGGYIFITVPKTKKNKYRSKVKMIAPRTFVALNGHEKEGAPHYLFNKELLRKYFSNFEILELSIDKNKHYYILGKLKNKT